MPVHTTASIIDALMVLLRLLTCNLLCSLNLASGGNMLYGSTKRRRGQTMGSHYSIIDARIVLKRIDYSYELN